ncbi:polysaccharide deacetylase family protein [Massilia solisilvae]|uniref:Polysaccharide deacetylase family protein n=1 Tax=Massilia solisilvae TaxID=1811225 RepID=A0ABT2BF36_9BURK|nr:polysaccharide deacetylase family protein [Massilia solisilvae]MCS0606997.1 polysaccharide deacetylase family protein [Massilia solisilvae]
MHDAAGVSLKGMVPLVLHRIVRGQTEVWEDVSEEQFRRMLDFIGERWAVFRPGGSGRDPRWMLTFDDGYLSDYDIVFPLLVERNIQATFFLITDKIGAPGYLDWAQIKEMRRHGMCFGSHSRSHRRMNTIPLAEAREEFAVSKTVIEDKLGEQVAVFSYPYGECSAQLHRAGFDVGYRYLCSSAHGIAGASGTVPRNSINSGLDWNGIERVMDPSAGTRLRWHLEDLVKHVIKGALGRERYMKWRNKAFHG